MNPRGQKRTFKTIRDLDTTPEVMKFTVYRDKDGSGSRKKQLGGAAVEPAELGEINTATSNLQPLTPDAPADLSSVFNTPSESAILPSQIAILKRPAETNKDGRNENYRKRQRTRHDETSFGGSTVPPSRIPVLERPAERQPSRPMSPLQRAEVLRCPKTPRNTNVWRIPVRVRPGNGGVAIDADYNQNGRKRHLFRPVTPRLQRAKVLECPPAPRKKNVWTMGRRFRGQERAV